MTLEPDHGFGLLSSEDQERLERILNERSEGAYEMPTLQGMLTASVGGPKPVPLDWIVQEVLSSPDSEGNGFDHFPEYRWAAEKIEELLHRISQVFQQNPEMFHLVVSRPNIEEGDDTPDPGTWCFGFIEAMMYQPEDWEPLLSMEWGILTVAPIFMTVDPDGWEAKNDLNPFKEIAPSKLCEGLKKSTLIHAFWPLYNERRGPIRASAVPGRNEPCPCGSGRKFKRCCGSRDGRAS
jgi:uncharacterized protein